MVCLSWYNTYIVCIVSHCIYTMSDIIPQKDLFVLIIAVKFHLVNVMVAKFKQLSKIALKLSQSITSWERGRLYAIF